MQTRIEVEECLRSLDVPTDIDVDMLSYTEKDRYRMCLGMIYRELVTVDCSLYDRKTLANIVNYLKSHNVHYELVNW
jgi:hypothetical protein